MLLNYKSDALLTPVTPPLRTINRVRNVNKTKFEHGLPPGGNIKHRTDLLFLFPIEFDQYQGKGVDFGQMKSVMPKLTRYIPGVTNPYYYIGSRKSMAPFHTEDANLLALNIMIGKNFFV